MNAQNPSPVSIGVVNIGGLDDSVVDLVRDLGVDIVTAASFRTAANVVKRAVDDGSLLGVIVGDSPVVGVRAWAEALSRTTNIVAVSSGGGAFDGSSILTTIAAPAPVWGILADLGAQPPAGPSPVIDADGVFRLPEDEDEPPAPVPAPVERARPAPQAPVATPIPEQLAQSQPPVAHTPSWLSDAQPQAAPEQPAAQQSQPPRTPSWLSDAPAAPVAPQPAAQTQRTPSWLAETAPALQPEPPAPQPSPAPVVRPQQPTPAPRPAAPEPEQVTQAFDAVPEPQSWQAPAPAYAEPPRPAAPQAPNPAPSPAPGFAVPQPQPSWPAQTPSSWPSSAPQPSAQRGWPTAPAQQPSWPTSQPSAQPAAWPTSRPASSPVQQTWGGVAPDLGQWAQRNTHEDAQYRAPSADEVFETSRRAFDTGLGKSAGRAPVVFTWAGKGGVGKTSTSIALAQRAGLAGLRVILIDASPGQAGVGVVLRARGREVRTPTIFDAASSGDIRRAFLSADALNRIRADANSEQLAFGAVLAPPPEMSGQKYVPNDLYAHVIRQAREISDLVVVDTQILETQARSAEARALFTETVVPILASDGWGVGISDDSREGFDKLGERLKELSLAGVGRSRMLTMINRADPNSMTSGGIGRAFRDYSEFLGVVEEDPQVKQSLNSGRTAANIPGFSMMLSAVLARVTGDEQAFDIGDNARSRRSAEQPADAGRAQKPKKRKGMFSFLSRR